MEYAREAVELLQAELQMDSTADLMAETDAKMEAQPGSAPLAAKLSILAAALYNQVQPCGLLPTSHPGARGQRLSPCCGWLVRRQWSWST